MKKIDKKSLVYASYSKVLQGGRYHGAIQTKYRVLCSSWLLATFAAVGFLLSKENLLPLDHLLAAAIICVIGMIGIYILWYADTFVEELLLDINVVEGLRIEKENPWAPQIHNTFLHLYKHTHARIVKVLFFIGCKSILMFTFGLTIAFYFYKMSTFLTISSILFCIILNILSSKYMIAKAGKIQDFMEFLWCTDERR